MFVYGFRELAESIKNSLLLFFVTSTCSLFFLKMSLEDSVTDVEIKA